MCRHYNLYRDTRIIHYLYDAIFVKKINTRIGDALMKQSSTERIQNLQPSNNTAISQSNPMHEIDGNSNTTKFVIATIISDNYIPLPPIPSTICSYMITTKLLQPYARSGTHYHSFLPITVCDWNNFTP